MLQWEKLRKLEVKWCRLGKELKRNIGTVEKVAWDKVAMTLEDLRPISALFVSKLVGFTENTVTLRKSRPEVPKLEDWDL